MTGHNVLHPMGWDAFGLPAEQYAIETGTHPRDTTTTNVARFREQLQSLGFSYDWDREVATCDPTYFKWTQWIFLQLLDKGLAYQAEVPVNWCPALGTVLANEEVIDGLSERGNHPVIRKPMKQWMLKITAYGDRLLEDLDDLDWPDSIKAGGGARPRPRSPGPGKRKGTPVRLVETLTFPNGAPRRAAPRRACQIISPPKRKVILIIFWCSRQTVRVCACACVCVCVRVRVSSTHNVNRRGARGVVVGNRFPDTLLVGDAAQLDRTLGGCAAGV